MAKRIRRGFLAAFLATAGVLLLPLSAAVAAPPASYDELLVVEAQPSSTLRPGGLLDLNLSASYYPSEVAQHRTVVMELPAGVTFGKADNDYSAGPCVPDASGRVVTCTTQDPVDERPALNAQWFVTAELGEDLPPGQNITVKTTLTTEIPDPDLSNNVGSWDFFIAGPVDMSATISAPPGPWRAGSEFDATITLVNNGPNRSPTQLYTTYSPSTLGLQGWPDECELYRGTWNCTFPMLEAGATRKITVHVRVPQSEATSVELSSTILPTAPDTDRSNNEGTYAADLLEPSTSPSPSPTVTPTATPTVTPTGNSGGSAGGEPSLPITGAPVGGLVLVALTLLAVGAGVLLLSRRTAETTEI